jgi:pimeloyl-ACP methyl ester carboxylesterase
MTDVVRETNRPFKVEIPDARLAEIRERVANTWWPPEPAGVEPWYYGADLATMKELVRFWLDEYDWREHEAHINSYPQFMVDVGDGQEIHTINVRVGGLPVLVLHGWPNSFHTYLDLMEPLSDPASHGAPDAQAFDVVLPSLPGYAFSRPVGAAAWLVEKWHAWADVDPESFLKVFPPARLLTEVLVYILPDRFVTATWLYSGCGDAVLTELEPGERVTVPVAVSAFPDPAFPVPPREFFERSHNVVRYTQMPHGGHYPGIEAPAEYLADVREFIAELA